jgi:hypothetical protein
MGQKNKQKDYNLKDYIWEEEEFTFQPKVNRHKKFLHAKKRQLEKEKYANQKKVFTDPFILDEHQRYTSKVEQSLIQDYYDREDEEDFVGYRIK